MDDRTIVSGKDVTTATTHHGRARACEGVWLHGGIVPGGNLRAWLVVKRT